MNSGPAVTTGKAAEALGIAPDTLQRWAKAGKVQPAFITAGGQYRWDVDDLRRQLAPKPRQAD